MALSLKPYTDGIRAALARALCIQTFPDQHIERQSKPEVEVGDNPELLLPHVVVARSEGEKCLIEPSINSVRISLKIGQADLLEEELARMYLRFLMQRAEAIALLRRTPLPGYDVSFLVTDAHLTQLGAGRIAGFVAGFIEDVDAEISSLKLAVNSRGRAVATDLLRSLAF